MKLGDYHFEENENNIYYLQLENNNNIIIALEIRIFL